MMATVKSNIRRMIMNREIRTDLAIELRESVGGNTEMEGVRVKTVVNEDKSIRTTTIVLQYLA